MIQARSLHIGMKGRTCAVPAGEEAGGICAGSEEAGQMKASQQQQLEWVLDISLADPVGVSTSVRPGRGRNRTKTELDEKVKKPADDGRKKSPPARKAPARGRYVDEYARPAR